MTRESHDVVIVGAGHGGAQAAILLRQKGFAGSIALVGDELVPPYERPPLSKEYLLGDKQLDRLWIRPEQFWRDRDVTMRLGERVVTVDAQAKTLGLSNGDTIGFGQCIWAAGGHARMLGCPGAELAGIHTVRTLADTDALQRELGETRRVVVIGGGYIGLEAAAALTRLGKQVTLLEALSRVLARVAGEPLSRFYEAEHRAHGVDIRLEARTEGFTGANGRVSGVKLADGEVIPAEMAIVGIGIAPNVEPLLTAGALGVDGVDVDAQCRTSLPGIYAIGDCAAHENIHAEGRRIRIESVQNANDQAAAAVGAIMGDARPYTALPWFWSNQYDLRLQTIGLSIGHDDLLVRGDPAARSFSVVYLRGGEVIALDCVNATRDFAQGRLLIGRGVRPERAALADTGRPLKELAT